MSSVGENVSALTLESPSLEEKSTSGDNAKDQAVRTPPQEITGDDDNKSSLGGTPAPIENKGSIPQKPDSVRIGDIESDLPDEFSAAAVTYPDGGLQAWAVVVGSFLVIMASVGFLNSFGVFQTYYMAHQLSHKSASQISWIGSLQLFVYFGSGAFLGKFYDTHGVRILLIAGTILLSGASIVVSFCTEYWQFLVAQGILCGLGMAMLFYPAISVVSTYFLTRRANASSLAISGAGVGGFLFPVILQQLLPAIGFAWSVRLMAFLLAALGIAGNILIKDRLPPKKSGRSLFSISAFRDVRFSVFSAACFCFILSAFTPFTYIQDYALAQGVDPKFAAYIMPIMNAAAIPGRIAPGRLGDKFGVFNLIFPSALFGGLCSFAIWLPAKDGPTLMVYAAAYGFFNGQ
ncbi:hypothetical protein HDU87_003053 [Geranomyces variabilis]|uniref:Major facilitator superfamily (MFS) profile domain-containing protein n=1 Tax=Geranomyces variabilis TaxID=109894 RepID=A0AAD5TMQ2_9FUNG|nr:hypothetical protein HDU87_003053 [Geranomyces variabilis]